MFDYLYYSLTGGGQRGRDRMVVGFTTTYANSVLSPLSLIDWCLLSLSVIL